MFGKYKYKRRGFEQSAPIYLTDDTIRKYINHPKANKNAVVPFELIPSLLSALRNPKYKYLHQSKKNKGNIIYVSTVNHPSMKNKLIKAVIHINFRRGKQVFHKLKSFGIINKEDIKNPDMRRIK